jgi:PAS domain S-box-containing protein
MFPARLQKLVFIQAVGAFLLLGVPSLAVAQSNSRQRGYVTDQSAAVVAGPTATATNLENSLQDAEQPSRLKRVVAVFPYQKDAPISASFDRTFQQSFGLSGAESVEYYAEYLDPYRFPDEPHAQLVRDYLGKKYAERKIDVVIAVTDKALEFLLRYRNELFTDVPIVFFVDRFSLVPQDSKDITGIINADVCRQTVKTVMHIDPSRKRVFVVVGSQGQRKGLETIVREQLKEFEGPLEITYLTDLPLSDVIHQISAAPSDSFVLYVRQTTDENGKNLNPVEGLERIVPQAKVPMYGVVDSHLGKGIVGGNLFSLDEVASQIAQLALRIANGTKPQDIPLTQVHATPMFDYRELQRWNIPESRLPPASIVRFKEPSFWQLYKWRLIAILAVTLAEAVLIVFLLLERRRRIRAHNALVQSEENLERSQAVSQVMTTHIGLDGRWLRVPPTLCTMLRYSEDQLLRSSFADITNVQDFQVTREKFAKLRDREIDSFNLEQRIYEKSGKPIWVLTVASLVTDKDQRPLHFLVYLKDITHSRVAEEQLRESEERFVKAFEVNPQPMALTGFNDDRYLDVNSSFISMSGYEREDIIGRTTAELGVWVERSEWVRLTNELKRFREVRNHEVRFLSKSGEPRVLLASAEILDLKGKQCVLTSATDITERKKLEEELKRSERDFSTLVENSPDLICRLDKELRYSYVSPSLKQLINVEGDDLVGKRPGELDLADFEWKSIEAGCRECIAAGAPVSQDFTYRQRSYWSRMIPEFSIDGSVESVMTISEDVTERLRAEQELAQLTSRLLSIQDEERRRIARDLHDGTAQNLFGISINLANLQEKFSAESHEVQVISDCQNLADESLREIRTLSYLLHPPLLDQTGLVSALQWYVEGFTKRSGIQVSILAQSIGRLTSEIETALFRIVQESLTNVRKHSGSNSVVIRLERSLDDILLEINDNGNGFKVDLEDPENSEFAPGVGIPGMKQRLRQLGGILEISSNAKGTKITAFVPLTNGAKNGSYSAGRRSRNGA